MNSRYLPLYSVLLLLSFHSMAQQAAFNQNSSRSNHTRSMTTGNDWQFGINSGASFGLNINEASLFRGNGLATGLNGQYFAGPLGLGISAGFINSKLNTSAINQFIIDRKFPQTSTITTTPAQNAFLMLGPSFRLGTKVQLLAGVKAGIFFNQGGGLIIGQQGALRPFYRFESGTKSLFPGFNGSVSFSYPVGNTSAIVLSTDYLRSSSSVQVFDPQRGIDIPVEQKKNFQTINAGVSFIKTFNVKSPRDVASGQASGKRSAVNNDDEQQTTNRVLKTKTRSNQSNDRVSTDTDDDGVSIIDPENKRVLKTKTKSNQSNDRTTTQSCGPVTLKTTRPDGTVEEQTFSCPDDALQYQRKGDMPNRISMNVTVPKQTQGATFGEKVNRGLNHWGDRSEYTERMQTGSHIISGRIIHTTNEKSIITNRNHIGGAAAASYAATGLMVQPGVQTNLYVRESNSGLATGKRTREAGSGMATGRRQYQPLFFDGLPQEDVCNPCLGQVKNNPLYEEKGGTNNPLYKGRIIGNEQCDDKNSVFDVQLIDRNTGAVVATTKTNACGEYWFANVPDGNYSVAVLAIWASKKGYDYYQAQSNAKINVAGEVLVPDETWQHIIYGAARGKVSVQDISVVMADTDGDGQAEFFRANGRLTDGNTQDFTPSSAAKGGGTGKVSMQDFHFTLPASNQRGGGKVSVQDIHFTKRTGKFTATATFSDGTTQDVTELIEIKQSGAVQQFNVQVGDVDGDGAPDLIWSPRSNVGVSSQSAKVNVQDLSFTKKTDHYIQSLPVYIGDVDGDGAEEMIIGSGKISDFGMSRKGGGFQNGDIPNQDDYTNSVAGNPVGGLTIKGGKNPGGDSGRIYQRSANGNDPFQNDFPLAIPGSPIGGLSIKGGKNPGGNIQQRTTNSLGEFEFENLEAGNYTFIIEATYVLNDVTDIDLSDEGTGIYSRNGIVKLTASQNSQSLRTNPATTEPAPNTKAQDYNSSRSNKTASIASFNDLLEVLKDLDHQLQTDNTPQTKAGVSTSRSNVRNLNAVIESIINDIENDNTNAAKQKMSSMNMQFLALQQSLQKLGGRYTAISNVLKTKHDTAKNSISNIR
ncbi:hypothetical protein PDL71_02375 [Lacibacter sp. MH-610]|uniref:hypothetical protein n=1 Tax=Lacibacter sp. MH-610 TaxID=3020883 RepID=UPI0038921D0A